MKIISRTFNCQIGTHPFPYLGLPLGLTKSKVDDFLPIVNRIERRLTSTSMFLNQAGKLEMVNSFLTALPTFHMCTLKLPPPVVKQIDKYRKHCLWRGADLNEKTPLAAWNRVTSPKSEGGLGVLKISIQNDALLLKNYHKFFNRLNMT
jgi:hypothetical protein